MGCALLAVFLPLRSTLVRCNAFLYMNAIDIMVLALPDGPVTKRLQYLSLPSFFSCEGWPLSASSYRQCPSMPGTPDLLHTASRSLQAPSPPPCVIRFSVRFTPVCVHLDGCLHPSVCAALISSPDDLSAIITVLQEDPCIDPRTGESSRPQHLGAYRWP